MRIKPVISTLLCIILSGLIGGCVYAPVAPAAEQPAYWPDAEWRTSTPEEQGLDSASISSMLQEIQKTDLNIHSVLIVRHGYLVTEVYFPPYTGEIQHPLHSITKSVTSAMTGIAINDNWIKGVQQHVLEYFPDIANKTRDRYIRDITIEHLLTMSAGFNTTTLPDFSKRDASFDAADYILTNSNVLYKPGETFFYNSGLPHVMSTIIQNTSGLTLEEYAKQKLFSPLGITSLAGIPTRKA